MLDQAVSQAENLAAGRFRSGGLRAEPPAQADRVGEIEPVSPDKTLDTTINPIIPTTPQGIRLRPVSGRGRCDRLRRTANGGSATTVAWRPVVSKGTRLGSALRHPENVGSHLGETSLARDVVVRFDCRPRGDAAHRSLVSDRLQAVEVERTTRQCLPDEAGRPEFPRK